MGIRSDDTAAVVASGERAPPGVLGGLDARGVTTLDLPWGAISVGLGEGRVSRNTSAALVKVDATGRGAWFGLFVGHDEDERSAFASTAAALACAERSAKLPPEIAVDRALVDLLLTANQAVREIHSHAPPPDLALGSAFTGHVRHLRGVRASACVGHFAADGLTLLRVGECSAVDATSGEVLHEADLLLQHAPSRLAAPCLSAVGDTDERLPRAPVSLAVSAGAVVAVCSAVIHQALESAEGREALRTACESGRLDALDHAAHHARWPGARAFLLLRPPSAPPHRA